MFYFKYYGYPYFIWEFVDGRTFSWLWPVDSGPWATRLWINVIHSLPVGVNKSTQGMSNEERSRHRTRSWGCLFFVTCNKAHKGNQEKKSRKGDWRRWEQILPASRFVGIDTKIPLKICTKILHQNFSCYWCLLSYIPLQIIIPI